MNQNPAITDPGAWAKKFTASELSDSQAYEIWRAMQLIAANGSLKGLPDSVVRLAMEMNHFLNAWKVVTEKALIHEGLTGKRRQRGFWVR